MNFGTLQIDDKSQLKLLLRISDGAIGVMIADSEPEIHAIYQVENVSDIKKFVYDNDFLLGDFESVDIVFSTGELFTAPAGTEELYESIAAAMLPDFDCEREILSEEFHDGCLCWAVSSDLIHFLSRTFACARFHHSLSVESFSTPGVYALNEVDGELNIIVVDSTGKISTLAHKSISGPTDCAYYILASMQPELALYLSSATNRDAIIDAIRQVAPNTTVLPLTLPENLLLIREKTKAPLDISILASK